MTDEDLEYWPQAIRYIPGERGKRGYHIDPTTGKKTYPSWFKRAERTIVHPSDVDRETHEPTRDERNLHRLLLLSAQQDDEIDMEAGIKTEVMIGLIIEHKLVHKWEAYRILRSLWDAGLLRCEGYVDLRKKYVGKQLWFLE